jgi:hypothetical protein
MADELGLRGVDAVARVLEIRPPEVPR